jgi:hypothetical protein
VLAVSFSTAFEEKSHQGEVGDKTADSTTVDDSGATELEPTTVGKMDVAAAVGEGMITVGGQLSDLLLEALLLLLLEDTETSLTEACANGVIFIPEQ